MKEIDLGMKPEKLGTEVSPSKEPKESYPSFSIYDKAPAELMKCDLGCEMTAKIKVTSKTMHSGKGQRDSIGFDVMSVMMNDKPMKKMQKSNATEYME